MILEGSNSCCVPAPKAVLENSAIGNLADTIEKRKPGNECLCTMRIGRKCEGQMLRLSTLKRGPK